MIFVDTSAWFAAFVPTDRNFAAATEWVRANNDRLVTTDFIVDELIIPLGRRGERKRSKLVHESLFQEQCAVLEYVTPADFMKAWDVHEAFQDKEWSFTDCTSYVVMQRMGIQSAFSFDMHFRQFATVVVVP
ncbi:MAG: type II toxin-antitoxin system VapC family toxin [Candidatus Hydrogenedentes bacterium]|nr:type II toxin-antitoxin system VapC family toxin [Candidatus Hydrogenedentota bacterium]